MCIRWYVLVHQRVCKSSNINLIRILTFMHIPRLCFYFVACFKNHTLKGQAAETRTLLCYLYKTNFQSKSRVCNSTKNTSIRVLWPLCTCSVYIHTMMILSNHYLQNCRRSCGGMITVMFMALFFSKPRVYNSTSNNSIRVLWPLYTCSVYIRIMVKVSNHYLENCRSWGETNPTMPCK